MEDVHKIDPNNIDEKSASEILKEFNNRDELIFGELYLLFYDELFYFTSNLYRNTEVAASDILQDIFLNIWKNNSRKFDSILGIKAYLYVSIRNNFNNYISHNKHVKEHQKATIFDNEMFEIDIIESEVYSIMHQAIALLPKDCAKIFKMLVEGWSVDEIAENLGKRKQTIYNKKSEAISILKSKLQKDKFMFILFFYKLI